MKFYRYTVLFADGTTEFVKNESNARFKTIDIAPEELGNAPKILEEALSAEIETKVRINISCTAEQAAAIDKAALLELGAAKVKVVSESAMSQAAEQDLEAKFDKDGLMEEYRKFCIQKDIENVSMGLHYLNQIQGICGN